MKYETFSKDVDQLTKRGVWPAMPTRVKVAKCLTKSNGINTCGFRESFVLGGRFFHSRLSYFLYCSVSGGDVVIRGDLKLQECGQLC